MSWFFFLFANRYCFILEIKICGTDKDDCHKHATCANIGPGLYKCTCKEGYTGDGKMCTGLNILICI